MAVESAQVVVGTTPTKLTTAIPEVSGSRPQTVIIQAPSGAAMFIGPAGVTTTTGYQMAAGSVLMPVDLGVGEDLYGVVATATGTAFVLRLGV